MSSRSAATLGQTRERVIILLVALSVLLIVQFFVYMLGSPDRIHLRGLPPVSASFAVLFLLIIYLQGSRRMTPWNAALLLIRGYTLGGAIAPFSGRLSDRMDARVIASIGLALQICGFLVYSTLGLTTPTFVVIVGAVLNGAGSSSFFPANNSAVMASAPARAYGVVSGLLRTFSNIGMVCSFVVALLITSLSIPRQTAFEIFLGVGKIQGQLSSAFVDGMHVALAGSISVLLLALVLSILRGKKARTVMPTASA